MSNPASRYRDNILKTILMLPSDTDSRIVKLFRDEEAWARGEMKSRGEADQALQAAVDRRVRNLDVAVALACGEVAGLDEAGAA